MPNIEVSEDQRDRLRDLQRRLESELPPYASVQPSDAVAYLLDRYADEGTVSLDPDTTADAEDGDGGEDRGDGGGGDGDDEVTTETPAPESESGGEGLPSGPMDLLADHDDVWREGTGDARYVVDLPDGTTADARTRGDVRALLFEHYR